MKQVLESNGKKSPNKQASRRIRILIGYEKKCKASAVRDTKTNINDNFTTVGEVSQNEI